MRNLIEELNRSNLSPLSKAIVLDLIIDTKAKQRQRYLENKPAVDAWIQELKEKGILDV